MNFKKTTLKNGLTIITSLMKDSPSVTVLVVVKTGSKYETKEINGLSHFLEHMCFKGTRKRPTAKDISIELDGLGAESNAFTSQEFTGYYARAHFKHFHKILDVVSDIYLNSVFDEKEIEKEKGVIIGELNMYEDMPHRIVHDVFSEVLYGDQPSGWPIIGTKENILSFKKEDFVNYVKEHYVASATTIFVSGSFDEDEVLSSVDKVFSQISVSAKKNKSDILPKESKPHLKIKNKKTDQTHLVLGAKTFDGNDERNYTLIVLNSILGGGMSSRLFQRLREDLGIGYYVRSNLDIQTDLGSLAVSAGVHNDRVFEAIKVILEEMKKMSEDLKEEEIVKAKEYLIGNMYLGLETSSSLAEYYAEQDVIGKKLLTPEEFSLEIQKVSASDIKKLASDIFTDNNLNLAIVGPFQQEDDFNKVLHF